MKNNELKDELKFVNSLVQILKKNKLNTIEVNRSFGEFDTVSIKVDGRTTLTSIERQDLSYPSKEINITEETEPENSKTKSKTLETVQDKKDEFRDRFASLVCMHGESGCGL